MSHPRPSVCPSDACWAMLQWVSISPGKPEHDVSWSTASRLRQGIGNRKCEARQYLLASHTRDRRRKTIWRRPFNPAANITIVVRSVLIVWDFQNSILSFRKVLLMLQYQEDDHKHRVLITLVHTLPNINAVNR